VLLLTLIASSEAPCVRAAPAPVTDREPTPAELEAAKQAYEKLGGSYQFIRDYRTGSVRHVFSVGLGLPPEALKHLPDPDFNYQLFLGVELEEGSLKQLARLRNLRHLQLQRNPGLADATLAELAALPRLERLDLECRKVTGQGLKRLAAAKELRALVLERIDVTDEDLKELAKFPKLEELTLFLDGRVTDAGVRELGQLKRLRALRFGFPQLTDEGVGHLTKLQGLESLSLFGPLIGDRGMKEVARLENLRRLEIFNTQVTDAGLKELSGLRNLRWIGLSGAELITDGGIKELTVHKGLQVIELVGARDKITDAALKDLARLKELKTIEIYGGRLVTDAGLKELIGLPKLTSLVMSDTAITDAGVKELLTSRADLEVLQLGSTRVSDEVTPLLARQKKLRFLDLSHCRRLTDESVKHLAACKGLELLYVHDSGITPKGMAELWRTLPGCRVIPLPPADKPQKQPSGKKYPKEG
jgi:hypothetical protein